MAGSAISTPTYQAVNANIANDGSADSPRGWAISTNADYTFTATGTSRARVTATSANRAVTLPTTNIKAGANIEVATACSGGYTIAVKSSDTTTIDTLKGTKGRIRLVALQDTPTASTHWEVVDVYDEGTWTPTVITSNSDGTATHVTQVGSFNRTGRNIFLSGQVGITNHTGTGNMRIGGIPYNSNSSAGWYANGSLDFTTLTVPANNIPFIQIGPNVSYINIFTQPTGGGTTGALALDVSNTLYFSIAYQV